MPEAVKGTLTEATTVIFHLNSIELFIIYVLEQWPQGKIKRQYWKKKQNT
jgi:hypothetical protein